MHVNLVTKCFILNDDNKILILRRHMGASIRPGAWDLPGGMIEDREDPNSAVSREIEEETNLKLAAPKVVLIATELIPAYIITFFYRADYNNHELEVSHEHTEHFWVSIADFMNLELPARFKRAAAAL